MGCILYKTTQTAPTDGFSITRSIPNRQAHLKATFELGVSGNSDSLWQIRADLHAVARTSELTRYSVLILTYLFKRVN